MIRPSQDPKFGDYQANFAMPLGKQLGRPPREVAATVAGRLKIDDLCDPPEVAGPGFINLRLKDSCLANQLKRSLTDERLAIAPVASPRKFVVDFSAPNVAKPMHVGHIRSTVIGDAVARTLRFLGHQVITDNHLGDWGTQFGMILYGYRHFVNAETYRTMPVDELGRLYRLVGQLVDYHQTQADVPRLNQQVTDQKALVAQLAARTPGVDKAAEKEATKTRRRAEAKLHELEEELTSLRTKLAAIDGDPQLSQLAGEHANIRQAVLEETARLHAGDGENLRLWREFLPSCLAELNKTYDRLGVTFDRTLGESFYHDRLASVVDEFCRLGLARESDGAICVFLDGFETPMIIRKQDGAYLYATTDLATIRYRMKEWGPDAILYVVDHRQGLHFNQLFAAARLWGFTENDVDLRHISFGTVLGDDGRPFKARSGDTIGLSGLLDEAVARAHAVVSANDDAKPGGADLSDSQRRQVAEVVGIGALKYADLAQNRTSDYVFSYEKMLAMTGNTATYMQYAYARVRSIFAKGEVDAIALRMSDGQIELAHPAERALGLAILQFAEALDQVIADFRPNSLTSYLFELANRYSTFFEQCPVLKAESAASRASRLRLCDLTARTIKQGLALLGIGVVEKM